MLICKMETSVENKLKMHIINIYAPNIGALQYVRQMLTSVKGEINNNTIIGETLIPHSHLWIDQLNRKLTRKHKL